MGFLAFLGSTLLLALGLLPWLTPEVPEQDRGERCALAFLVWFAILVALNWGLAGLHLLAAGPLYVSSAICAMTGGGLLLRRRGGSRLRWPRAAPGVLGLLQEWLLSLSPLMRVAVLLMAGNLIYLGVRSFTLGAQVMEFDALSYHFPKAVEICRAHTLPRIHGGDYRIPYFPWNYELLLADGLLLTPGDYLSFLIPLLAYGGFGCTVYALFRKAWPGGHRADAVLGVFLALATPILILHITANKNDLLAGFFQMAFILWSTAWFLNHGKRELFLALISFALFFGTKSTALFLGPVLLVMVVCRRSQFTLGAWGGGRKALLAAGTAILVLGALGAAWPLLNLAWTGKCLGEVSRAGGISSFAANAAPRYGGWSNLWRFPVLVLLKPFSHNDLTVWVPWEHRYWFWPTYRLVYGHFGWLCTVLLGLLPLGIRYHRRQGGAAPFRRVATASVLAFTAFSLPQQYRVDGMFCGAPRYLLALPVLVLLWTSVPLLGWLRERRRPLVHGILGAAILAYFAGQSWLYLRKDEARSLGMVAEALEGEGTQVPHSVAEALNAMAGPGDCVAFDGGFGALFYPLYGPNLQRPLRFLVPAAGPVAIPDQAKWVVIDRSWNMGWSHPGVTSCADFFRPIHGLATAEDLAVFRQLAGDPAWQLVAADPENNEAIFLRKTAVPS
jgi:hypothetical protein